MHVLLQSGKNNGYFIWRLMYIDGNVFTFFFRVENVSDKICRETQNMRFMFNNFYFKKTVLFVR